jgi:hypothetical protein
MLTVKFMKFSRPTYSGSTEGPTTRDPGYTEAVVLHPAKAVFVECSDAHGRQVVGIQNPVTDEIERFTIGDAERDDIAFNVAYVMNDAGKTVETVR